MEKLFALSAICISGVVLSVQVETDIVSLYLCVLGLCFVLLVTLTMGQTMMLILNHWTELGLEHTICQLRLRDSHERLFVPWSDWCLLLAGIKRAPLL